MTIVNEELMHECFPKHLCMGTAIMKREEVKMRCVAWKDVKQAQKK